MARTTNNSNRKYRRLTFQGLEARSMMTGNVAVSVLNGDLRLTGDTQGNEVAVVATFNQQGQLVPGSFRVDGLNGTTVNGATTQTMPGVTRDFAINLGEGNDRLTLGDNGTTNRFTVPTDLRIDMGNGTNTMNLNGITVRDDTFINTGSERDELNIRGVFGVSGVENGQNDMTITTRGGVDIVRMRNTFVRRDLTIDTGTDNGYDMVDLAIMNVGHDVRILTGAGRDTVSIDSVGVNNLLRIDTGADLDNVFIKRSEAFELIVDLGAGTDYLDIRDTFGRRATLNGGPDADTLFETNVSFPDVHTRLSF